MNKCLILTEVGEGIGYGHLTRCTAILDSLLEYGKDHAMQLMVKGDLEAEHPNVTITSWLENSDQLAALKDEYDLVLIDSYLAQMEFYQFLKDTFSKVIAVDDYNRITYPVPYVLNPNIFGKELPYSLTSEQHLWAGKDYVVLRKEFRMEATPFVINKEVKHILITIGGSDIRDLIPLFVELLPSNYQIIAIAGSGAYQQDLEQKYPLEHLEFRGFVNAQQMKELMCWSDICISACGQTLHELAYLGIPTIGVCIDIDQVPNTQKYTEIGFLEQELMWDNPKFEEEILKMLNLYQKSNLRMEKSRIGKQFIDGNGVKNISKLLINL